MDYPRELDTLFDLLQQKNIRPIIVGGYVRDSFLGKTSKDIDIELYGVASLDKVAKILEKFGDINSVGKSFGVCKLRLSGYELDFSLPRKESKIGVGHRGFVVDFYPEIDFKTATSRRDFTINAIGYDVIEKKILDPFGGREDLKKRVLRAVDLLHFADDPLRVLRAAQFCARFELSLQKDLFLLCKEMVTSHLLEQLPKERIFEEIKKLLLKAQKPSLGVQILQDLHFNLPVKKISIVDLLAQHRTTNEQTNLVLMLAGLFYHLDEKEIERILLKLTNEKKLIHKVIVLVRAYQKIEFIKSDYALYKLATEVKIEEFILLSRAIFSAHNNFAMLQKCEELHQRAGALKIMHQKLPPLLMGRDIVKLGIPPSQKFTHILEEAYEAQMHATFTNYEDALIWLRKRLEL